VSISQSRSLLKPLSVLLRGVERVDRGDLEFQIPVHSRDEIGQLTNSFNKMTRTVARQREELKRESITDGLTGLYNQRHFRARLMQEVERAERSRSEFCLLMIDVDYFKQYNDAMGHESGNDALKAVAEVLRQSLRDMDSLARYGGDELSVILPDTTIAEGKALAARINSAVRRVDLPGTNSLPTGRLTLSIGGASFPHDAGSAADVILKADEALYAAKRAGRARLCWADEAENVQKTG
jgi:diguanylate cyclase (GGDEF)-like protein